jgi:hypothetical protein
MVLLSVRGFPGRGEGGQLVVEFFCAKNDALYWGSNIQPAVGDDHDLVEGVEYVRPPHMDDAPAVEIKHVGIYFPFRSRILQDEIPHNG